MQLSFYPFGIIMRKNVDGIVSEYPVDPETVAETLAQSVTFDTGFMSADVLLVRQSGPKRLIVEYRKPQLTGIFLEGDPAPLRVPMPGLVMAASVDGNTRKHIVYAVKSRPKSLDAKLYHSPLPNVYKNGGICWGSVPKAMGNSLEGDWTMLLGSPFGSHATSGKSLTEKMDIRIHLRKLAEDKAKRYPLNDLVEAKSRLDEAVKEMSR